ncbi:hypothetical protein L7F22_021970 [Adiantum nelumboides]|nr:hypothetical protein [Adiantum nelumboides]
MVSSKEKEDWQINCGGFGENDTIEKIVEKPKVLLSPTSMDSTMEDLFKGQSILTNLGSARMEKNADEMISTKSAHVMEICKDDNEEVVDTIQETTGRTNPVDSLLEVQVNEKFMEEKQKVEEEILKVQTNEAFVKDKRNNEEEILEISKGQSRASIRTNGEQMPKATPSLKAQIKDASKDKKQSKVCGPSFKLSCDIELATTLKVFKELIDNKVKVTWRDILGWNKEGFWNEKKFKKRRFSQDFLGVKKDQILQGVFSSVVQDIDRKDVSLSKYKGKVLLVVNVASRCGLTTSNYTDLARLYKKLKGEDFEILAFPCNQFGGQEPGNNQQIKEFACSRFKAEYPIFDKVDVNGFNTAPVYKFLKSSKSSGLFGSSFADNIKWNFAKFLVDKNGQVVHRYEPSTLPLAIEVLSSP